MSSVRKRLYREDGLSCFQNMKGSQAEKVENNMCEIYQNCNIKITVETNLHITDFCIVTFN